MGNTKSQQKKQIKIGINHPRMQQAKITGEDNQRVLQVTQSIDQKEYERWALALKKYRNIPPHLLLPLTHSFSKTGLCGNAGVLKLNYDNYPHLLSEEIYIRKERRKTFAETELWLLLFSLSSAVKEATAVEQRLGDIRPNNIFLNEDSKIKVSNSLSWPLQITNVQKYLDKIITYLSPEDLNRIKNGQILDRVSDASEAYSIGLTLLSAANLQEYDFIYNLTQNSINSDQLISAISKLAVNNQYSVVLRGTILSLLNSDPIKRLSCSQLSLLVDKHAQPISQQQNFVIDNAPNKLHETIFSMKTYEETSNKFPIAQTQVE